MPKALTGLATAVALALIAPTPALAQLSGVPVTAKGVEFVKNIALHNDSAGARLHEGYFYVTTERDLTIYDVSKPEDPRAVGTLAFPQPNAARNYYFAEEDPDTNGEILITSNEGAIEVIDVRDKTKPAFLSKLPASTAARAQHTISCVLDCTWAYGSEGSIIDLRDPAKPRAAGSWEVEAVPQNHDVTEVSPGIVLTSSQPMLLLDARTDPAKPTVLARMANADGRYIHANLWPHLMQDDLVLVGGEGLASDCALPDAPAFQTYDASRYEETGTFELRDEFRIDAGFLANGRSPASTYCVHWFDTHPSYRNGGMVAIAWYEHGTRFLQVSRTGEITEVGHYLPLGTSASAVYWVTDKIAYITDYNRGLDIVRFTDPVAPGEAPPAEPAGEAAPEPAPQETPATRDEPKAQDAAPADTTTTEGSSTAPAVQGAPLARPEAVTSARRRASRALGRRALFVRQLGTALLYRPAAAQRVAPDLRAAAVVCDAGCRLTARRYLRVRGRLVSLGRMDWRLKAGQTVLVPARLTAPQRAAVRRAGRGSIVTRVTVVDGSGRQTAPIRTPLRAR